mgnify:CR=1 FL=1
MRPTLLIENQGSHLRETAPSVSSFPASTLEKSPKGCASGTMEWKQGYAFPHKMQCPQRGPEYAHVKEHTPASRHPSMRNYLAGFSGSSEARMPMVSSPMTTPRLISGEICTMPTTSKSIFTPMYARMITTDFSRWRR